MQDDSGELSDSLRSDSNSENGQEAGIRTRTVSFTGRDAANYTTILRNWCPRQELHLRPPPSQSGALIYLSYADKMASVAGLAPARVGLKTRLLELLCIHGRKTLAWKTKPTGWLLAGKS
jgi:hypothetical protein